MTLDSITTSPLSPTISLSLEPETPTHSTTNSLDHSPPPLSPPTPTTPAQTNPAWRESESNLTDVDLSADAEARREEDEDEQHVEDAKAGKTSELGGSTGRTRDWERGTGGSLGLRVERAPYEAGLIAEGSQEEEARGAGAGAGATTVGERERNRASYSAEDDLLKKLEEQYVPSLHLPHASVVELIRPQLVTSRHDSTRFICRNEIIENAKTTPEPSSPYSSGTNFPNQNQVPRLGGGGVEYGYEHAMQRRRNGDFREDEGLVQLGVGINGRRRVEVGQGEMGKGKGKEREEEVDWDFWSLVVSDFQQVSYEQPEKLSHAIQKGIPSALRGEVWLLMATAKDTKLEQTYSDLLKQTSEHEKAIRRDLGRTFPLVGYFKEGGGVGQENLFNVVKAYSLYDHEVGYMQGLAFIVGPFLLNMPDEAAFSLLVRLMNSYDLRSHYVPSMPGLTLRLYQFDRLVEELLPALHFHFHRRGVKSSMYASQWILTLFSYRFPLELVSAVFDLIFAEGVEIVLKFCIALLKRSEEALCGEKELDRLLEMLKNDLYEVYNLGEGHYDSLAFISDALSIPITPHQLDQYTEEHQAHVASLNQHLSEISTLRRANSQLSAQVRGLEASLQAVNNEHVALVKEVVIARIEKEEIESQLVRLKVSYAEVLALVSAGTGGREEKEREKGGQKGFLLRR